MGHTAEEIASQPACWQRVVTMNAGTLPRRGERVAVVGCGTSWFMAQSYAVLRETAGHGLTDAFPASEFPAGRDYDRVLALTRSGTTTEVLDLLARFRGQVPTVVITADPGSPVLQAADEAIVLDFADEQSVVQTRFATTQLMLLRAHLGLDTAKAIADATTVTDAQADTTTKDTTAEDTTTKDTTGVRPTQAQTLLGAEQFTFLGRGWTYGLAQEAALKMREAARAWTEAYPAMEYRHGPISIAAPDRVVWMFGPVPDGLAEQVTATGATLITSTLDPLADLIRVQRLAVALAHRRGLDPDVPRNLTRSVILT